MSGSLGGSLIHKWVAGPAPSKTVEVALCCDRNTWEISNYYSAIQLKRSKKDE